MRDKTVKTVEFGMKVKNQPAIRRLALRNYKENGRRNRTAIGAIILTTMLFTVVFTLGLGLIKSMEYNTMRMSGGMAHGSFKYLSEEQFAKLKEHPLLKKVGCRYQGGLTRNIELIKRPLEIDCVDETVAELMFLHVDVGRLPKTYEEVVVDTVTLDLLKIPHELGQTITLEIDSGIMGEKQVRSHTFTLCGYYEPDKGNTAAFAFVSKEFIKQEYEERGQQYLVNYDSIGSISSEVMFENSKGIKENIQKVIIDSGYYIWDEDKKAAIGKNGEEMPDAEREDSILYGVNWAYMNASTEQNSLVSGIIICLICVIFVVTGYLIIYNIFQISVIRDIRFFGLLKTIGTTEKQIHAILLRQAMQLCIWGIPIGLLIGFFTGRAFLPLLTSQMYGGETYESASPVIFIGSALFSIFTVWMSCKKPAKMAGRVSPVEAVKYNGVEQSYIRKKKNTTDGAKVWRMAFSNLGRNRKRTIIAVLSMSLGLILMNVVATVSNSFDMNTFLSKFVSFDFQIAHASYFNLDYYGDVSGIGVSDEAVHQIELQEDFQTGGSIYTLSDLNTNLLGATYQGSLVDSWTGISQEYDSDKNALRTFIYGMDEFNFSHLTIVQGEYNQEKLMAGEGVLLGITTNDYGVPYWEDVIYQVGDKIPVKEILGVKSKKEIYDEKGRVVDLFLEYEFGEEKEYEVLGYYEITQNNGRRMYGDMVTIAMADTELKNWGYPVTRMIYSYEAKEGGIPELERFTKDYTEQVNPLMHYISRETFKEEFAQIQHMVLVVGGTMAGVIGVIGILNFINSMSTSITTRRRELAMLKSIGMTGVQMKKMLVLEGLYYVFFTIFISLLASVLISFGALSHLNDMLWLLEFKPTFFSLLASYPILFALAIGIPLLYYYGVDEGSIVEQLRMAD